MFSRTRLVVLISIVCILFPLLCVAATPHIDSVSPTTAVAGTQVTIIGTNFQDARGTGLVRLGTAYGVVTSWSDTQIVATVASGSKTGTAAVYQGGVWSAATPFTVITPVVISVTPTTGIAGAEVTIVGTGFQAAQGTGLVRLGTAYGVVKSWSDTQIVATIASGSKTGTAAVYQGGVWSAATPFTVVTPVVTSVTPTTAVAGMEVTIVGTGFQMTRGTGLVRIGTAYGVVTSWNDTQIVATVATGSKTGTAAVYQGGVWSDTTPFTVITPAVTSVTPTTGVAGTEVAIVGTGFQAAQGTGLVRLGTAYGKITSWSDTQIVATIASGSKTGTAAVYQGGVWSTTTPFTVITPVVTTVTPTTGVAGTEVTITGTGFQVTQGTGLVRLGTAYGKITSWSDTQIVATIASGSKTGTAAVYQGGVWSDTTPFTVITPVLSSVTPLTGVAGTTVTIAGTGFQATQGTGLVRLGTAYGKITSWSDTQIVATIASGSKTGTAAMYQGGVWTDTTPFTVITPVVSTVSATTVVAGADVTITGTGFQVAQGTGLVRLGTAYAKIKSWSDTQIVATVPTASKTGTAAVYQGGVWSNTIDFTVTPFLVASVTPTSGAVGTSVTILGTGFKAAQGTSTVTFNGVAATPTSWSDTSIVVPVPLGATTGSLVVTIGTGSTNAGIFAVVEPPSISGLSPTSGKTGITVVTISGRNFGPTQGSSTLTFNGGAASPTSWTDTQIVTTVPQGAKTGPVRVLVSGLEAMSRDFVVTGQSSTTTTLSVSRDQVTSGSVVTMTASVSSSGTTVVLGKVVFCNANTEYCEDSAILGSAWLTPDGTASVRRTLPFGTNNIKAIYAGTKSFASSISSAQTVLVTGIGSASVTTTTIDSSGTPGNYTFTGTVTGLGNGPTGNLSFISLRDGENVLKSVALGTPSREFVAASSPATGNWPLSVASGDFNGDGISDLVALNDGDNTFSTFLGNGDGSFVLSSSSVTGVYPHAIRSEDLNGDGIVDLVIVNSGDNTLSVLLGRGDGTFALQSSPSTSNSPQAADLADFNNDGIPDIVVATDSASNVLLGNGDGTFRTTSTLNVGGRSQSVSVGDFNADGYVDLAFANPYDNCVSVFLGAGDGTFIPKPPVATGAFPVFVTVGDFNKDGIPDLITTNLTDNTLSVLLGQGDGTFISASSPATGTYPQWVSIGDLNGDGFSDLVVANDGDNTVSILSGNGDGTFSLNTSLSSDMFPNSVVVRDFNGDGVPDIAVANGGANNLSILLQHAIATGTASGVATGVPGSGYNSVIARFAGDDTHATSDSYYVYAPSTGMPTALSLASSKNSSSYGDSVTFTVSVSPSTATPGSVTFFDGDSILGSSDLWGNEGGVTSFSTSELTAGTHQITATFWCWNWYGTFEGSSTSLLQNVNVASATVSISSTMNPSFSGPVTFKATVIPATARGTVVFRDSESVLGTAVVEGGLAMFTAGTLAAGTHPITAVYSGDVNDQSATSGSYMQVVHQKLVPSVTLNVSSSNVAVGQLVTLTATVTSDGKILSPGHVFFCNANALYCEDSAVLGSAWLSNDGIAKIQKALPIGTSKIKALFVGPKSYEPAYSSIQTVSVAGEELPTATTLSVTGAPGDYTLTGTVTSFGVGPTGLVSFLDASQSDTLLQAAALGDVTYNFTAGPTLSTGNWPGLPIAGDFNNDGIPDIAVDSSIGQVFLLGRGDGSFTQEAASGPVPDAWTAMADFDGDGIPDTATVPSDGTLAVQLGNGGGTAISALTLPCVINQYSLLVVGDFNRDGIPDLAVGCDEYSEVLIMRGLGDGTFGLQSAIDTYDHASAISVADFNNDGVQDLAISFFEPIQLDNNPGVHTLEVYLGTGDGTFTRKSSMAVADFTTSSAVGDFNRDGVPDLILSSWTDYSVALLLGRGDGTFQVQSRLPAQYMSSVGAVADFNLDGVLDFAVVNRYDSNLSIWLGQSNATASVKQGAIFGFGTHEVFARYDGNGSYAQSKSANVVLTAGIPTVTTVSSGSSAVVVGGSITFTAAVIPSAATGTITFTDGTTALGTVTLVDGLATLSTSQLSVGSHSISASYSGDINYLGSNSSSIAQVVNPRGPTISGVSPARGPVGTAVVISGSNFGSVQSDSVITFNGVTATSALWNDGHIVVRVPGGATSGPLTVNVAGGVSSITFEVKSALASYSHVVPIKIDHAKVQNSDLVDFPVLLSANTPALATVANGGFVESAPGYDIAFTSDAEGLNLLDHEIDTYDSVTGAAKFWVRVPSLLHTADTRLFLWFGNPQITTSQENSLGVWRNGYAAVYHLGDGRTLSPVDSLGANGGTPSAVISSGGLIGGSGSFSGSTDSYMVLPDSGLLKPTSSLTLQAWVNHESELPGKIISLDYRSNGSWTTPFVSYALGTTTADSTPSVQITTGNGFPETVVAAQSLPLSKWSHLVATYDGSQLRIYLNGAPDQNVADVSGLIDYGTSCQVVVGKDSVYETPSAASWWGLIDEVRISSVARSADWIATEYKNQSSPETFVTFGSEQSTAGPVVYEVLPTLGPVNSDVTILGANLGATQGESTVSFNGENATIVSWGYTEIVSKVPNGATTGPVAVQVNGISIVPSIFTVQSRATIDSVSPLYGSIGAAITITGSGFGNMSNDGKVTFNGIVAVPSSWSAGQIVVPIPVGAVSGPLCVWVSGTSSNCATITITTVSTSGLAIVTSRLSNGTVGQAYSAHLVSTGGVAPYRWTVTGGSLPSGLSLDAYTGQITGTASTSDVSEFVVQVTDQLQNSAIKTLSITIGVAQSSGASVVYTYDSQGRISTATYSTQDGAVTVTYTYDNAGNRTAVVTR